MPNRYERLLSPIQVGNVLLKNRMVSTAGIPHMLQGTEEYPTDRLITHLANRAKNGAAAVYLNFAMAHGRGARRTACPSRRDRNELSAARYGGKYRQNQRPQLSLSDH